MPAMIHSRRARTTLSLVHVGGVIFSYGGMTFVVLTLLPFMLAGRIPQDVLVGMMGTFLPIVWAVLPVVITAGILKIFEHLTKIQDMGPALGTLYGKTVLTKMLVGSIFITNALLITGTVAGKLPLGELVPGLLWVQLIVGVVMIGFGVTLRNIHS